jgi:hypothetical protein
MVDRDLLEILNSYDVTTMELLLNQGNRGVGFLGFVRQYNFIKDRDILSLFFVNTRLPMMLDPLFSHYLISDIKVVDIAPNLILLNPDCIERITKIKLGVVERLKISEPLLERIGREALSTRVTTYIPEPIQLNQLNGDNLIMLRSSWQTMSEAEASNDRKVAATTLLNIADIYERESIAVSERNPDMAKTLSQMSSNIKAIAPEVKKKRISISDANQYTQLNREVD